MERSVRLGRSITRIRSDKRRKWLQDVEVLEQVEVSRRYFSSLPDPTKKEIHAFCDASQNAYAEVIYIRTVTPLGNAQASLVMA